MELGCRFLVHYICREMLINAYALLCPSVPVCIKIVDGGARRRRRAACAVPFSNTNYIIIYYLLFYYVYRYRILIKIHTELASDRSHYNITM